MNSDAHTTEIKAIYVFNSSRPHPAATFERWLANHDGEVRRIEQDRIIEIIANNHFPVIDVDGDIDCAECVMKDGQKYTLHIDELIKGEQK